MENTPLQTLLDERKANIIGMVRAHDLGIEAEERFASEEEKTFLQGVRLGLAMGRECVLARTEEQKGLEEYYLNQGWNACRYSTLDALEAKEKELGV